MIFLVVAVLPEMVSAWVREQGERWAQSKVRLGLAKAPQFVDSVAGEASLFEGVSPEYVEQAPLSIDWVDRSTTSFNGSSFECAAQALERANASNRLAAAHLAPRNREVSVVWGMWWDSFLSEYSSLVSDWFDRFRSINSVPDLRADALWDDRFVPMVERTIAAVIKARIADVQKAINSASADPKGAATSVGEWADSLGERLRSIATSRTEASGIAARRVVVATNVAA
ncbi:MAG: hypothetical protein O3B65_04105 [Chloroflexi bacterium]|nr:hypothetical protein [Chloroflexota bacterium]